uniref:gamma-glutamylcyclotransferase n=1 Tax=Callorhinchus milii TaxID=7868 RepID=A0A4W3GJ00_CALMI|eukprot:gi/632945150/ref/XP_007887894.1/ PREDICTED: gamma-glutamylcyclotransferase [Callorhinchus milii]
MGSVDGRVTGRWARAPLAALLGLVAMVTDLDGGRPDHPASFLYFSYGSNLLQQRLRLNNPSAVKVNVGCLKGYKLAFGIHNNTYSRWGGASATIVRSSEDEVWGVVWRLNLSELDSLDKQEGVPDGHYNPIEVIIKQISPGEDQLCRSYQMNVSNYSFPSQIYKEVICTGAKQNGLPAEYVEKLLDIETNSYNGTTPFILDIKEMLNQVKNNLNPLTSFGKVAVSL